MASGDHSLKNIITTTKRFAHTNKKHDKLRKDNGNLQVCEAHEATEAKIMTEQLKKRLNADSSLLTSVGFGKASIRQHRPRTGTKFSYFIYRKGTNAAKPVKLVEIVNLK